MSGAAASLTRLVAIGASWAVFASTPLVAQDRIAQTESARVIAFINEPREPEFGEVFELEVQVRITPGLVAFLSDTMVDAASSVGAGPGTWTTTVGPGDSLDIRATYPVMGFLPGGVELPFVEVWTRPARAGETPGVRSSEELSESEREAAEVDRALLYLGGIFVMPPSEMIGDDAVLEPRPPADVVGGERSAWLVAALVVLVGAVGVLAWILLTGRTSPAPPSKVVLSPREEALRELDRIRELGWHANGRIAEFYEATTGVLRRYAERQEPGEWRSALTSSELMARLAERRVERSLEPLGATVWTAECVKFGGRRPDAASAETDWAQVRDWIEQEPDGS